MRIASKREFPSYSIKVQYNVRVCLSEKCTGSYTEWAGELILHTCCFVSVCGFSEFLPLGCPPPPPVQPTTYIYWQTACGTIQVWWDRFVNLFRKRDNSLLFRNTDVLVLILCPLCRLYKMFCVAHHSLKYIPAWTPFKSTNSYEIWWRQFTRVL